MIKKIAVGTLVIIAIIFGLALTKPDTFAVQRVVTIKAPPEKIAPLISDFHNWGSWSPWEALDPKMQRTFSGAAAGKGAVYAWKGNKDVGQGRMEITDETPPAKVVIKLDFLEPFASHNVTEFTLKPQGDSTIVTWNMTGPMPLISKIMSVFASMDKMIGPDFEKGLAKMKTVAEK
ncbi:MAG: SRPBCC family protein [Pseudomonadota bacterium]